MKIKTKTALAEHYKVSRVTIHRWVKTGMPVEESGDFDTEKIDAWLRDRDGTPPPGLSELPGGDNGRSKQYWETQAKRFQALERELKVKIRKGELLHSDEVVKAAYDCSRRVRDAILNIPDRISAIIAAETDETKIRKILMKEFTEALMELSTGKKFD